MRVERNIHINAPVPKVFDYLADLSRHAEWGSHPQQIKQPSREPVTVGTVFEHVGHQFGKDLKHRVTVTELASNSRIVLEADGDTGGYRWTFLMQQEGEGTRLIRRLDPLRVPFPTSLVWPLMNRLLAPRFIKSDLRRIKAKVEAS